MGKKIRILLAKPGFDGHDNGIRIVARTLMDADMEIIYLGLRQSPEDIARAAAQEEPSVVGLSILTGAHVNRTRKVIVSLGEVGCNDISAIVGGMIRSNDVKLFREAEAAAVFGMRTPYNPIVSWIKQNVQKQRKEAERFS